MRCIEQHAIRCANGVRMVRKKEVVYLNFTEFPYY